MSWFYIIVSIIAVITLIISLTAVGMVLSNSYSSAPFPAYQNVCPDFWDVSGTVCKPLTWGINTPSPDKFYGDMASIKHLGVDVSNNTIKHIDTDSKYWTGVCDQGSWAKTNGIYWDGVANNNSC
jgi:hypothetical protein